MQMNAFGLRGSNAKRGHSHTPPKERLWPQSLIINVEREEFMKRLLVLLLAVVIVGCAKKKIPLPVFPPEPQIVEAPQTWVLLPPEMRTIYFDTDKYNLKDDAVAGIVANIAALAGFDIAFIAVQGHADERHTELYNLVLGQDRANAVAEYLQGHGYTTVSVSYGESRPVCNVNAEVCWWHNRRVVLDIVLQE